MRTRISCRAGCSSRWPHLCSSGSDGASTSARGMRCAAAGPTWTSWSRSARPWRGAFSAIVTLLGLVRAACLFRGRRGGDHAGAARKAPRSACQGGHVGGARRPAAPAAEGRACDARRYRRRRDARRSPAGDRFVVRAGESVPVDGIVRDGASTIDESMLTGESRAVAKAHGATVYAGTVNQEGMLTCDATGVGTRTLLAGSCAWSPRRKAPRRRSSAWPIASRACSSRWSS